MRGALVVALALAAVPVIACNSKVKKQTELASKDLDRVTSIASEKFSASVDRGLPAVASAIAPKITPSANVHLDAAPIGSAIVEATNRSDDLRGSKRSYIVITDAGGEITWVDDDGWKVVGRKTADAFPAVVEAIAGKSKVARGMGRYGGAGDETLSLVAATALHDASGGTVGALAVLWEARDAASDLTRQLLTDYAQKSATPLKRVRTKDRLKLALDQPDVWVALIRPGFTYLEEDAPQQLEDALKPLDLGAKTASGRWMGTFDVMNSTWGGAAARVPSLGPDMGLAVVRHEP